MISIPGLAITAFVMIIIEAVYSQYKIEKRKEKEKEENDG